jgi:hypothetical protein
LSHAHCVSANWATSLATHAPLPQHACCLACCTLPSAFAAEICLYPCCALPQCSHHVHEGVRAVDQLRPVSLHDNTRVALRPTERCFACIGCMRCTRRRRGTHAPHCACIACHRADSGTSGERAGCGRVAAGAPCTQHSAAGTFAARHARRLTPQRRRHAGTARAGACMRARSRMRGPRAACMCACAGVRRCRPRARRQRCRLEGG